MFATRQFTLGRQLHARSRCCLQKIQFTLEPALRAHTLLLERHQRLNTNHSERTHTHSCCMPMTTTTITITHTHEIYSRSMKLHKWPPACHQLGPPGTHGRPRDSFSARPQNPEEPHPPCNAMRHTTACLSRACLWLGSLLWGEY
jgi:hypothetical protein